MTSNSSNPKQAMKAPSAWLMLLEGRFPWEFAAALASSPWLRQLPRGDGHPVLVFPGFTVPDLTTLPLRNFLRAQGYEPRGWEQGFNLGPREGVLEACVERAEAIYREHQRPLSLIGWSLGGIYAREVAKALPQQTRCVITLGTPFGGDPRANNAWRAFQWISGLSIDGNPLVEEARRPPPNVPTTSIYSRSDGVVSWQCSLNEDSPLTENVEIPASHLGLGMNPWSLCVVADRLAQDPANWQRFDASAGRRKWFFKTPPRSPVSDASTTRQA